MYDITCIKNIDRDKATAELLAKFMKTYRDNTEYKIFYISCVDTLDQVSTKLFTSGAMVVEVLQSKFILTTVSDDKELVSKLGHIVDSSESIIFVDLPDLIIDNINADFEELIMYIMVKKPYKIKDVYYTKQY